MAWAPSYRIFPKQHERYEDRNLGSAHRYVLGQGHSGMQFGEAPSGQGAGKKMLKRKLMHLKETENEISKGRIAAQFRHYSSPRTAIACAWDGFRSHR
ncbi:hypothetical protein KPH14_008347 [Odynerus spinipes]|uniref:Uncharacterized protein n=1 Tax=Odynerus spinipes TaxID=1348599 RepID=A0AAD9VIG6_9HYME|nr:hypothetical protein KPH14_008347 [Odynerus spinipes]